MAQPRSKILKAPPLEVGDIVGLVAPGGPPDEPKLVDQAVASLRELGFRVRMGEHLRARHGYLAGSDADRLHDLQSMIDDPEVKGIFFLRGGYGTLRIISELNFSPLKRHPKVVLGHSDVTPLLMAITDKTGLVTFHGPLALDLPKPGFADYSKNSLLQMVGAGRGRSTLCRYLPGAMERSVIRKGRARGRIIGGNLTLISMTLGTDFEPDWRGKILILEEVMEAPYRIDRALMHLELAGVFDKVAGVAIGQFTGCEDKRANPLAEYRQSVADVLADRFSRYKIPVVAGLPFGHVLVHGTVPIGVDAILDTTKRDLLFQERGVRDA